MKRVRRLFDCHNWLRLVTGIQWVENKVPAKHPAGLPSRSSGDSLLCFPGGNSGVKREEIACSNRL